MAAQAGDIRHAGGEQGDDKHPVHRGLRKSPKESPQRLRAEHERDSHESPAVCFFADSSLVYLTRRDSQGGPIAGLCRKLSPPDADYVVGP